MEKTPVVWLMVLVSSMEPAVKPGIGKIKESSLLSWVLNPVHEMGLVSFVMMDLLSYWEVPLLGVPQSSSSPISCPLRRLWPSPRECPMACMIKYMALFCTLLSNRLLTSGRNVQSALRVTLPGLPSDDGGVTFISFAVLLPKLLLFSNLILIS